VSLLLRHKSFLALFTAAAVLRLYGLAWLPSPEGDEGNWILYAWRLLRGEQVQLDPDGSFVSLLYAWLMAASMAIFGAGFWAGRLVGVAASLAAVAVAYAVPVRLGSRRAGLATAGVLAFHPWCVLFARVALVPYQLALATGTVGPLLLVLGLREKRPPWVAAGVLVMALGAHFSPLAIVAAVACLVFAARREHRWVFSNWMAWAAVAASEIHVLPVIRGAAEVARAARPSPHTDDLLANTGSYLHMMATGLAGEATLRHFTNTAIDAWPASLLAVPVVGLAVLGASAWARREGPGAGFGIEYLLTGLLLTPLVLAPAREWFLPASTMDRYLFTVLPGFAILMGDLAATRRSLELGVAAFTVWLAIGCTGRAAWAFLASGGVDHGELVFRGGGGHRGHLVSDVPQAVPDQIVETVLEQAGRGGATILYVDRTFMPLRFAAARRGLEVEDVRRTPITPRPDGRFFAVLYPDGVLSLGDPPTAIPKYVEANARLRERLARHFGRLELVRTLRQRDGSALLEIWRAEEPIGRLSPLHE
jgi:4-amino-4-deoxy-L-arabinose transferase-like glycosyltransferase